MLAPGGFYHTVLFIVVSGALCAVVIPRVVSLSLESLFAEMPRYSQTLGKGAANWWGYWNLPTDAEELTLWSNMCGNDLRASVVSGWIALVFAKYVPAQFQDLAGWLILFTIYANRIAFPIGSVSRFVHGLDLMLLGLVCNFHGFRYKDKIGDLIMRYWFLIVFLCAFLRLPGVHGRLDVNPPTDRVPRARVNLVELIFLLGWITAADRLFVKAAFSAETFQWLNTWALFLYLGHYGVHIVVPKPWNWVVLVASPLAVYLLRPCIDSTFARLMTSSTYGETPDESVALLGEGFMGGKRWRRHSRSIEESAQP